jgi:hypothetical protein
MKKKPGESERLKEKIIESERLKKKTGESERLNEKIIESERRRLEKVKAE